MLRELRIRHLGVIAEAVLAFEPGMTALTGETGAGKTMITSGLGLLLGGRSDATVVRHDTDKALVEGRFEHLPAECADAVAELGGELDDGELLVARHISAQGRSRAFVGGAQATLAGLGEVTTHLATIHGQSEQVRLASPERQREVLDRACGHDHLAALQAHAGLFERRRQVRAELDDLVGNARERARELDLLQLGLDDISAVDPQPGEDEALAAEAARLGSLDRLRELSEQASELLSGAEDGGRDDPGAVGMVGQARRPLEQLADLDERAAQLATRATELGHLVNDLAADVASYRADLEADPHRYEQVVARQAALAGLTRKYGNDVAEVLAWAQQSVSRLDELQAGDDRIDQLRAEATELDQRLAASARSLHERRAEVAAELAEQVHDELAGLAMPRARIEFQLTEQAEVGRFGADQVQLLFSANAGAPLAPLAKVASGGELSRVRLALEVVLAGEASGHTFVFDEVDAGIGGAVALEVGRRLARLAEHSQVLVVTHLAQVAAFAHRHYVVTKETDGEVTASGVQAVTGTDREAELARMMAGLHQTKAARTYARELLAEANTAPADS